MSEIKAYTLCELWKTVNGIALPLDDESVSKKAQEFMKFASAIVEHIENYVVPQYGDKGAYLATDYTAQQCVDNIKRYAHRFGQNSRPEETLRDLLKIAHYAQMAYMKAKQ